MEERDEERERKIKGMEVQSAAVGSKEYVLAYSLEIQEKLAKKMDLLYKVNLALLVALVIIAAAGVAAFVYYLPLILKLDIGNWLTRLVLTCR